MDPHFFRRPFPSTLFLTQNTIRILAKALKLELRSIDSIQIGISFRVIPGINDNREIGVLTSSNKAHLYFPLINIEYRHITYSFLARCPDSAFFPFSRQTHSYQLRQKGYRNFSKLRFLIPSRKLGIMRSDSSRLTSLPALHHYRPILCTDGPYWLNSHPREMGKLPHFLSVQT